VASKTSSHSEDLAAMFDVGVRMLRWSGSDRGL
jgi:hypothetical protein